MRGPVLLGLVAVSLAALALGLTAGLRVMRLDEGAVIADRAARYVAETGGRAGDCIGVPGQGRVWIRVICDGDARRVYGVSRWGGDVAVPEPGGI
ncbi:hypothetical protein ILP92_09920 [Maribius pontilimi]|uniref:Uncharacterized protein n=1 Tax=Palleronia pontilimi TaxID=1964209 RepID=A0A934IGM8_9RHOB|nr:hypothetical protein [Palleronia pontilimi]MBJ3763060.1 hypothetical protein [Palleronia pontilimi]